MTKWKVTQHVHLDWSLPPVWNWACPTHLLICKIKLILNLTKEGGLKTKSKIKPHVLWFLTSHHQCFAVKSTKVTSTLCGRVNWWFTASVTDYYMSELATDQSKTIMCWDTPANFTAAEILLQSNGILSHTEARLCLWVCRTIHLYTPKWDDSGNGFQKPKTKT